MFQKLQLYILNDPKLMSQWLMGDSTDINHLH